MNVIADTSVWIDFFNGIDNAETRKLKQLHRDDETILLLPVIIQEILQGFRNDLHYTTARKLLLDLPVITADPLDLALDVAKLYRSLRRQGITAAQTNDCLIAAAAIRFKCGLLSGDSVFKLIAKKTALTLI